MLKTRIIALVTIINFISDSLFLGITPCDYYHYSTHRILLIMASGGDEIYEDVDANQTNFDPDDNNDDASTALNPWWVHST